MYIRVLEDSERLVDAARGQKLTVSEEIYGKNLLLGGAPSR